MIFCPPKENLMSLNCKGVSKAFCNPEIVLSLIKAFKSLFPTIEFLEITDFLKKIFLFILLIYWLIFINIPHTNYSDIRQLTFLLPFQKVREGSHHLQPLFICAESPIVSLISSVIEATVVKCFIFMFLILRHVTKSVYQKLFLRNVGTSESHSHDLSGGFILKEEDNFPHVSCAWVCARSCPTLCNHMDCSQPGCSVHGISQARILEWVAMPSSRGSSQPRDWTQVFRITGRFLTFWATREAPRLH